MKNIRLDGLGIFLLGLAAFVAICAAVISGLKPNVIGLGCVADCLDREDLGAQINMAWAAWVMASLTTVSIIVGAVSVILIWQTLEATRESVKVAQLAGEHARDTLEITRASVEEQHKLSRLQTRSYITVTEINGTTRANSAEISLKLHNSGTTPAFFVRVFFNFTVEIKRPFSASITKPTAEVAAGRETTADFFFNIRKAYDTKADVETQPFAALAEGRVEYFDVFGRQRVSYFMYDLVCYFDGSKIAATRSLIQKSQRPDFMNDYDEISFR